MHPLPDSFTRTVISTYPGGAAWLDALPALIDSVAHRWHLTVLPPFDDLSYNYVAPAIRANGSPAVLKLGVPNPEMNTEIEALRRYDGRGIARLLAADAVQGAMLIERLQPGARLSTLVDDGEATSIAAGVMRDLWLPLPDEHPFPTVAGWADGLGRLRERFNGGTGPFPAYLVDAAERLFAELLASQSEPVLLHGDLHHYNILSAERAAWLAIDPKGIAGEACYEVGALLRNPIPQVGSWPDLRRILARRIDILHDQLGFDRARMIGWGVAQAVESAWWSIEDGTGWGPTIIVAEHLAALL